MLDRFVVFFLIFLIFFCVYGSGIFFDTIHEFMDTYEEQVHTSNNKLPVQRTLLSLYDFACNQFEVGKEIVNMFAGMTIASVHLLLESGEKFCYLFDPVRVCDGIGEIAHD